MLRKVTVRIPPLIADVDPIVPNPLLAECDAAARAIGALDHPSGQQLQPLAALLLRAESVASSKIEREEASIEDFARAMYGVRSNRPATAMAAAAGALDEMVSGDLTADALCSAHRRLMSSDPTEAPLAGRWREVQNWIGGSDYSPRRALHVPPPPELVDDLMADLIHFASRTDLPALPQAALAHAQFESIHPFTDGNGRIGRALAAGILRRRQVTVTTVVPIASALVGRRQHYFDSLGAYRDGDGAPIVAAFARSARVAAEEARITEERLVDLQDQWHIRAGRPRSGSTLSRALETLAESAAFSVDDLQRSLGASAASCYRAVDRMARADIVRPLTDRTRDQIWGVSDLLDELDDLGVRIASRSRELLDGPSTQS